MATFVASLFASSAAASAGTAAGATALTAGSAAFPAASLGMSFGSAATGLTAVSTGVPVVAGAASSGLSFASILKFAGAGFQLLSGLAGMDAANKEAEIAKLQAERAQIQGLQDVNDINRELIERAAANNAATRAGGLTLVGSPDRIDEALAQSAGRNISVARGNARVKSATANLEADVARARGLASAARGIGSAATSLVTVGGSRPDPRRRTSALRFV